MFSERERSMSSVVEVIENYVILQAPMIALRPRTSTICLPDLIIA